MASVLFGWFSLHLQRQQAASQRRSGQEQKSANIQKRPNSLMPTIPQTEVLAISLKETGEKCGKILAQMLSSVSCLNFQRKWWQEILRKMLDLFHNAQNSSTYSTMHRIKLFHCCNSASSGDKKRWGGALKTLTSLEKEFGVLDYFSLAIIAFGVFPLLPP